MIESVALTTAQKAVMQQNNNLKKELKEGIQMSFCCNIKLSFFFFFWLGVKVVNTSKCIANQIPRPVCWTT